MIEAGEFSQIQTVNSYNYLLTDLISVSKMVLKAMQQRNVMLALFGIVTGQVIAMHLQRHLETRQ